MVDHSELSSQPPGPRAAVRSRLVIVICTHNRADALAITLASVAALTRPAGVSVTILVVANACTDHTADVVADWRGKIPEIEYVEEEAQGLSHARNRALREVAPWAPELIIWTDDDVSLPSNWLESYWSAATACPDIAVFGGPVVPVFEGTPPKWLLANLDRLGVVYAAVDFGESMRCLLPREGLPFGANFAVRESAVRGRCFDPRLGVSGSERLVGEETALMRDVLGGASLWCYVAAAPVRHRIPPERQRRDYVRRYFEGVGATEHYESPPQPQARRVLGVPIWMFRGWMTAAAHELTLTLSPQSAGSRFRWTIERHRLAGAIKFCRRAAGRHCSRHV